MKVRKPSQLVEILTGGSAMPQAMIDVLTRDHDIAVIHGWGMTEMSPVGTLTTLRPKERTLPALERAALSARQGRRIFGVDLKIIANGNRAAADGETAGELFVRGPAVASGYYENDEASRKQIDAEGWFATGDVAKLTCEGWLLPDDVVFLDALPLTATDKVSKRDLRAAVRRPSAARVRATGRRDIVTFASAIC